MPAGTLSAQAFALRHSRPPHYLRDFASGVDESSVHLAAARQRLPIMIARQRT